MRIVFIMLAISYAFLLGSQITAESINFSVPLTVDIRDSSNSSVLVKSPSGKIVPSQVERDGEILHITWMHRGEAQPRYKLVLTPSSASALDNRDPRGVKLIEKESSVDVMVNGRLFTSYIFKGAPKPYIYPIIGPTGKGITRNYPMKELPNESRDHAHHRSLWFTHGNVNGIDFWTESPKNGRIVHREFKKLTSGPLYGHISTVNDWIGPDGKKICEDTRDIYIYNTSGVGIIDFKITIKATDGPVTFGDTKEGMFGIRIADSMTVDRGKGRIQNSRGDLNEAAWGKQAEWCDYYGPVDDEIVGVAIMNMPSSFRFPTYWHVRTYGLFAANPFGLRDFTGDKSVNGGYTIPKEGTISFAYRIYIHKGTTEDGAVADVYRLSTCKPDITVIKS